MRTGAVYADRRIPHPSYLLRCTDAEAQAVETLTLHPTSAFGQIESAGVLKPGAERHLRELEPTKRKADRLLLEQAERIQRRGRECSALAYAMAKGA